MQKLHFEIRNPEMSKGKKAKKRRRMATSKYNKRAEGHGNCGFLFDF